MKKVVPKRFCEMKLPARASVWYIASGVFGKGIGFLATVIFTRLLTPYEFGEYAVYMSWLGIGEICVSSFISSNVIYKGLGEHDDKKEFINAVSGTFLILSTAFCVLLFTFSVSWGFEPIYFPFLLLQILLDGCVSVHLYGHKHRYSHRAVIISTLFEAVFSLILSILFIRYAKLGFWGRIFGNLIPTAFLYGFFLIKQGLPRLDRRFFGYLVPKVLPMLPSCIALALTTQIDKLIINAHIGTDAAARYSVVHSVGALGMFLVGAVGSALHPWLNRKLKSQSYEIITNVTESLLDVFSAFSLFLIAMAPIGVRVLAPEEYSEALPAVLPIAISIIPYFAASLNNVRLIFLNQGRIISKISILSGIVGIASNLLFVRLLGYFGAGLGIFLSSAVSYFSGAILIDRFDSREILPRKYLTRRLILFSISAVGIFAFYHYPYFIPLILIFPALTLLTATLSAKRIVFE